MILPAILAGPIVRRATADAIHVWICTSTPFDPGLGILVYETKIGKDKKPFVLTVGEGRALRRLRLGEKLYIHLLQALPAKGVDPSLLPQGILLSYDIRKMSSINPDRLGPSILTREVREALSLANENALPTVVLQKDAQFDLRALYASCRKLHGPGNDAFVKVFSTHFRPVPYSVNRPNVLLLIGDQIYADDVSALLLGKLEELSKELIGFRHPITTTLIDEDIPDRNGRPLRPEAFRSGNRQSLIATAAGFTTTEGSNHLARFGEFAAMYLLSWSGDNNLWPLRFLDDKKLVFLEIKRICRGIRARGMETAGDRRAEKEAAKGLRDIENIKDAHDGALALRKILANTPAYMIFDDHDVTDDWNFTPAWQTAVKNNKLGSRIVANALAAYAVFQGWGNDPAAFKDSTLLHSIEARFARSDATPSVIASYESELFSFQKWSFLAPTVPPTLFVDSRTRRDVSPSAYEYKWRTRPVDGDGAFFPTPYAKQSGVGDQLASIVPSLIDSIAVEYLKGLVGATGTNQRLILVTPGPIFDVPEIDAGKKLYAAFTSAAEADQEGWMTNKLSFLRLMQVLKSDNWVEVIMLSGDVHYAFSAFGLIEFDRPNASGTLPFKLFNSSAVKNSSDGRDKHLAKLLGELKQREQLFYLGEDKKHRTYYSSSGRSADTWLYEFWRRGVTNPYRVDVEFRPLRVNGVQEQDMVATDCNIGYLRIMKGSSPSDLGEALSDFIVRKPTDRRV